MELYFELDGEYPVLVTVTHYVPERPAPSCQNPSSPVFSDCGDSAELEYYASWIDEEDNTIELTKKEYDFWEDALYNQIINYIEK